MRRGRPQPARHASSPENPAAPRRRRTAVLAGLGTAAAVIGFIAPAQAGGMHTLVNPSFGTGTTGWTETTPLGRVTSATGRTGRGARLSHTARTGYTVILNDATNTVRSSTAGASYTALVWVRASRPTTVNLRLRELKGVVQGEAVSSNAVGAGWTRIGVTYTARTSGAAVDLNVLGYRLAAGATLDVDDVTFTSRRRTWSDEFNGTALDRRVWTPLNNSRQGVAGGEQSCYLDRPANLTVASGTLQLIARRENQLVCGVQWPEPRDYSSAFVETAGRKSFTRGRFEMRAKLPTGATDSQGLWSAFWLWPEDNGPGELDVVEAIGTSAARPGEFRQVHQFIHYDAAETHPQQGQAYVFPRGGPSDGFHTYVLEWNPDSVMWFVDGRLTYLRDLTTTPWIRGTFTRPMYLKVSLTAGATWPGMPSAATQLPAVYAIDHIRVHSPAVG